MNKNREADVISALKEKGATQPCPRCRNLEFEVIGRSTISVNRTWDDRLSAMIQPANSEVPVVLVSCKNCGYISQHALGVLAGSRRA